MKKSWIRIPVLAAAAFAVFGATPAASQSQDVIASSALPRQVDKTVVVRNHNSLDVEIVAVTEAGRRFPLGAVNHGSGRTFVLPRALSESGNSFRLKIYSIAPKVGPSITTRYLGAVKTQLLSPSSTGSIVLQVQSPLASTFIDRGPGGGR